MTASGTAIEMASQLGCAAALDGVEYAQVVPRKPGPVLLDEAPLVLSDDIGHLERWPVHRLRNFRESFTLSGLEKLIVSKGLATAVKCFRERCR
jgi:hypothetical protein